MNNLPAKKDLKFWQKVKGFFENIIKRITEKKIECRIEVKTKDEKSLKERMKDEIRIKRNKDDILKEIEKNPYIIYEMSDKRLEQLSELYDEKLREIQQRIVEVKSSIEDNE